ncbi:MAG TPA: hypothetical protein VKP65_15600 [Rhodothermales bacterium]|nr:hypothetical protein [Rhodothermales bacterium]
MKRINAITVDGTNRTIVLRQVPDTCPVCHVSVYPELKYTAYAGEYPQDGRAQVAYQCTRGNCQEVFIASYRFYNTDGNNTPMMELTKTAPKSPLVESFSDEISQLSPAFVEIYNQALAAEAVNLEQLVGIGLRKALEFLMKDFAVHENPDDEEKIRKMPLARCIRDYAKDPNLKDCATRAAWLGNDETHYTRRWVEQDINDLKLLIRLTVNWVENVLLTEKYKATMQDGI